MQPINYTIDVKQPFTNALSGVEAGFAMGTAMDKAEAQKVAIQKQQEELEQRRQMQADLAELSQKTNPTAQDFASITTKYPALAEHFKNTWSMLNTDQQQSRLSQATQVYAALQSGNTDVAKRLLNEQIAAARNSGREQDAKSAETMLGLVDTKPEFALNSAGLMLSSVLGPEKFSTTFSTLAKLPSEIAGTQATTRKTSAEATKAEYEAQRTPQRLALEERKTAAEIRNIDSQVGERSARLSLDRDKLQSETELKLYELGQKSTSLDGDGRKLVNESVVQSVAADQAAGQMTDLANRLEAQSGGYGVAGRAYEWFKNATGNQDYMTQLRNEYVRIKNGQAIKMLPPGSASDKDIQIAMRGFPEDTADTKVMASFMRGMAKLNQLKAVTENAKAEWVNSVGHLGKPKQDINIDGINVPAGSTFTDFARQYLSVKAEQRGAQRAQQNVNSRSYMRWANPQGQQ
jgi:uncharacterized membrane-anchored protein YhcB (DUF1043 family)